MTNCPRYVPLNDLPRCPCWNCALYVANRDEGEDACEGEKYFVRDP